MSLLSKIDKYLASNKNFALLTVVDAIGSTPRKIGAKMILFSDGVILGTIGGGKIEYEALKDAKHFLMKKKSELKEYYLDKKHGALCGGSMKVFIETFSPDKKLIIVGAGHIGIALYKLAIVLNFKIIVMDARKEFLNKTRFPEADKIILGNPSKKISKVNIDKNTYIVILTHSHKHDYEVLKKVINLDARYIGMIGSYKKVKEVLDRLNKEGVKKELLKNVSAPIGLNLGAETPEEIALSILAEIIASYNNQDTSNLRFKKLI
ncbi:MAG: XdhC/CoxI family protein [Candidatus Omnitrophota bacterium]